MLLILETLKNQYNKKEPQHVVEKLKLIVPWKLHGVLEELSLPVEDPVNSGLVTPEST